jgi:predicted nucleic acid-binding protein
MRRRIYVDTSVFGGCFDEEFEVPSRQLFERFRGGEDILVISELTRLELGSAPTRVRELLDGVPALNVETIDVGDRGRELAESYVASGAIGRSMIVDAQHIAVATVHRVDVLVSWNFRHIVNLDRIHGYNSVNLREGYPLLEIRTPPEVLTYDQGEDARRRQDDAGDPGRTEPEAHDNEP